MKKLHLLWVMGGLLIVVGGIGGGTAVSPAYTSPQSTVISDGAFAAADWGVEIVDLAGGASQSARQETSGGNPGAFRAMTHTLPQPSGSDETRIAAVHLYQGQRYNPSTQGALDHIDFTQDGRLLSLPWPDALVDTHFVIAQGGVLYRSSGYIRFFGNTNWNSGALNNLQPASFTAIGGGGGQPDFSAGGGEMTFGYLRLHTRLATLPPVPPGNLVIEHAIDNWQVTLWPDATPPANQPPVAVDDLYVIEGLLLPDRVFIPVLKNDSDPDNDPLSITDYTQPPIGGSVSWFELNNSFSFVPSMRFTETQFTYELSDGTLTDTGTVNVMMDCACVAICILYGEFSPAHTASDNVDLALIYRVRDEILKSTPQGRQYIDYYYESNPEILWTLLRNESLRTEAVAVVELWQDNLRNLVAGDGSTLITQAQVTALKTFLTNLAAANGGQLQQLINAELARLGPLDDYVGLPMEEARTQAIGDPTLHLPIVMK